jgi:hypothetical protein
MNRTSSKDWICLNSDHAVLNSERRGHDGRVFKWQETCTVKCVLDWTEGKKVIQAVKQFKMRCVFEFSLITGI